MDASCYKQQQCDDHCFGKSMRPSETSWNQSWQPTNQGPTSSCRSWCFNTAEFPRCVWVQHDLSGFWKTFGIDACGRAHRRSSCKLRVLGLLFLFLALRPEQSVSSTGCWSSTDQLPSSGLQSHNSWDEISRVFFSSLQIQQRLDWRKICNTITSLTVGLPLCTRSKYFVLVFFRQRVKLCVCSEQVVSPLVWWPRQ